MAGKLYGVGVGPGDPELLTLKALRVIRESTLIAVPGRQPKETMAYRIASQICPEIEKKRLLGIHMPMTKDDKMLQESHREGIRMLAEQLAKGEQVAFLTLGDPTVYSTYLYLHQEILRLGYEAEIVNGIPSFCAAAARLNVALAERSEQIHVIPATYQIREAMELPGTKVLMKTGKKLPEVKERLKMMEQQGAWIAMVENCGMAEEQVCYGSDQIPEDAGYYSLLLIKDKGEK